MRRFGQFVLVTLVRGILFLVPIVLIAVLAREGYQMLRRVSQPVARLLPRGPFLRHPDRGPVSVVAIAWSS